MKEIIIILGILSLIINLIFNIKFDFDNDSLLVICQGTITNIEVNDYYFGVIFDQALTLIFGFDSLNLENIMKVVGFHR